MHRFFKFLVFSNGEQRFQRKIMKDKTLFGNSDIFFLLLLDDKNLRDEYIKLRAAERKISGQLTKTFCYKLKMFIIST